jgi:hypothetical protein
MEPATASILNDLPRLVCLVAAFALGLISAATLWRRRASTVTSVRTEAVATNQIIYRDAPTVRVVGSQRVDRLRKSIRLACGQQVDVLETDMQGEPRFRITLQEITEHQGDAVRLSIAFGKTQVSCGPLAQEVGPNEFILPLATADETRSSIFHYREANDTLDFMRLKLKSVDRATSSAELDVMQVSGHWPATH